MNDKPHIVHASLIALIVTAIYIPAITITGEFVAPLKNWLTTTYGHHWVGKGVIMMFVYGAVFIVTYLISKNRNLQYSEKLVYNGAILAIISSLTITLFFVFEYVNH